ncbi:MAG TPA: sugar phosphate isomerase/epimerase [Vicinamibacterales bacterium]
MPRVSRREFITGCAMLAGAAAGGVPGGAMLRAKPFGLPIGSQTYPHRQMIRDGNFAGLLETLKGIGVESIELCSPFGYSEFASLANAKEVRQIIADHGLTCQSSHFGMRELRENQQRSIDWAHDVGITQMYVATLGGGNAPSLDDVKRAADEYNRIAGVAAKAGIQQGLHNEGFELSMVNGRRTYDVLMDLLDPALVKFQFQMSTITRGFVAADYFTRYPGRFISMHVQDVDPSSTADHVVQTSVGRGTIDWAATFRAAPTGGVKSYYVEQNMELTKASVAALAKM